MIRKLLIFFLCLCVGGALGTFTAFQTITHGLKDFTFEKGPWKTWHSIGKPSIDPYTHAKLVVHRWLPSSAFETLYFVSSEDDTGETLNPKCTYLVSGRGLKSNIWSLSVYQTQNEKELKDPHRLSTNSESILRDRSGGWKIQISPTIGSGNTITHSKNDSYRLVLRLHSYEQAKLDDNFGPLPKITKVSCS